MVSILLLVAVIILAVISITVKKTVPAVLSFALLMFLLGLYYIGYDEKLLGLFQIFVYTGGIVVLVLFGVTVIGSTFPEEKSRPWAVASIVLIAIGFIVIPFIMPNFNVVENAGNVKAQVTVLTENYAEVAIFLAVVGASLLYGSIRMLHTLKHEKELS
ncbi:MAG: NADH-quinone oxidoreductase subunit J [Epsilonproteobacteria bacterium]|nr:NADH-quinone oxidoreductase subunit J [Campylobacterota bacterium]